MIIVIKTKIIMTIIRKKTTIIITIIIILVIIIIIIAMTALFVSLTKRHGQTKKIEISTNK